ncbi:hypothetical protein D3C78_1395820 [compost metagenome]
MSMPCRLATAMIRARFSTAPAGRSWLKLYRLRPPRNPSFKGVPTTMLVPFRFNAAKVLRNASPWSRREYWQASNTMSGVGSLLASA